MKEAVESFLRFTDKPMVATKDAVTEGLSRACEDGLVGIGRGGSPSSLLKRYCRQPVSLDPVENGVWVVPPFVPEPATGSADKEKGGMSVQKDGSDTIKRTGTDPNEDGGRIPSGDEISSRRSVQVFAIEGEVHVENWGELFRCFVNPAARMNLKELRLGVQFEMALPDDGALSKDDPVLKAMEEAAKQLGLKLLIEE